MNEHFLPASRAAGAASGRPLSLEFLGRGSEYFGIWITNLLLTVLTLGLYSAWAKVRRLRYFHRNTLLDGQPFDYHGEPRAILIGRVILLVLMGLLQLSAKFDPGMAVAATVALYAVLPWLLARSLRFRWGMTSWRGLRFSFHAPTWRSYLVFLGWPALATLSAGLLTPMAHHALKAYQMESVSWGRSADGPLQFQMGASRRDFIRIYGRYVALVLLLMAVAMFLAWQGAASPWMTVAGAPQDALRPLLPTILVAAGTLGFSFFFIQPALQGSLLRRIWDDARMGPLVFHSRITPGGWWRLSVSNLLLTLLTFGLYRPFAAVRRMAYLVEHIEVRTPSPLDAVLADAQARVGALGDAGADLLNVDMGL